MDTKQASTATFTKFRGQWAARVPAAAGVEAGDQITITKKSGQQVHATVTTVLAKFDDNHIVAFNDSSSRRPAARRRPYRGQNGSQNGVWAARDAARYGRCEECGGALTDFDRRAACVPGFHFDCA